MRQFAPSIRLSLAASSVLFGSAPLLAGGFEFPGVGARALSMGGAFTGLADDWTATYWNPAGLTQLPASGVGFELNTLHASTTDGNSIANPTIPTLNRDQSDIFVNLGGEPSRFNVTSSVMNVPLPSLGAHQRMGRWTFAESMHTPLGFSTDIADGSMDNLKVSYKSRGVILMSGVSAATRVGDRLSVGIGFHALTGWLEREARKASSSYAYRAEAHGHDSFAPQGMIGLLYEVTSRCQLGAVYRTPSQLNFSGDAEVSDSRFPLSVSGRTLQNEKSAFVNKIAIPATYAFGVAWKALPAWTLTADWQGTDWRPMRSRIRYDTPGVFLQNRDVDAGWRFTHRARVGSEVRFSPSWVGRLGFSRDPQALPDRSESITNLVDISRTFASGGVGWSGARWKFDVGYQVGWGSDEIAGVHYERRSHSLLSGVSYSFT